MLGRLTACVTVGLDIVVAVVGVGLAVDGFAGVGVVVVVLGVGDGVEGEATHEGG